MARRSDLDQQLDAVALAGSLFGLASEPTEPQPPAFDLVGWMRPKADTCRGKDHLCRRCQDAAPKALAGPWLPVQRSQLAAKAPCSLCGNPLEQLDLTIRHDCDERCTGCFDCYRRHGHTVCSAVCVHRERDDEA